MIVLYRNERFVMKKILIVEDDIYIGNMVEEALRKNGYGVSRAYSGTEALLVIKDAVPDLILLDLMLPGLSGEALLPKIKSIPVIVVSAKTTHKTVSVTPIPPPTICDTILKISSPLV